MAAGRPAAAEHRRLLVWWLTGAATLLVILAAFAGYFVVTTFGSFVQSHRVGCLPSDFPVYPRATILEVDQTFKLPGSAVQAECRMRLSSAESFASVDAFYRAQLNSGDWAYSSYFEDTGGASIAFYRRSNNGIKGAMDVHKQLGGGTPFEVQLSG